MKHLKISILILTIFSSSHFLVAQSTKKTTVSKQPETSEIDKVYEKYKGLNKIDIPTTYGNIKGDINIKFNRVNKPSSIIIMQETDNARALSQFLSDLINQKIINGYKSSGNIEPNQFDLVIIKDNLLNNKKTELYLFKGNMYFKVSAYKLRDYDVEEANEAIENSKPLEKHPYYLYKIETGDKLRLGSSNFEF